MILLVAFHRLTSSLHRCSSSSSIFHRSLTSNMGLQMRVNQSASYSSKRGHPNVICMNSCTSWKYGLTFIKSHQIQRQTKNYSSSEKQHKALNETKDKNSEVEYVTMYYFPYMKYLRIISRIKLAQTFFTVSITPLMWHLSITGQITENQAFYSVAVATFALMMLYAMSVFLRRIIGIIYLHQDRNHIKVAHLTFWGNRRDLSIPVSDVIPIAESGDKPSEILLRLKRYSTADKFYFTLKYGQVTDRKRFCEVFGDL